MALACALLALNQVFNCPTPPSGFGVTWVALGAADSSTATPSAAAAARSRETMVIIEAILARQRPMPISGQYNGTRNSRMIAVTTERMAPTFSMSLLLKYPYE